MHVYYNVLSSCGPWYSLILSLSTIQLLKKLTDNSSLRHQTYRIGYCKVSYTVYKYGLLYVFYNNRHVQFSSAPGNDFIAAVRNCSGIPSGTVGFNYAQVRSQISALTYTSTSCVIKILKSISSY